MGVTAYFGRISHGHLQNGRSFTSILLFPAGDKNTASTRLRLLTIVSALDPGSLREIQTLEEASLVNADIAWFQKKLTPAHVNIARKYKKNGCTVVYDCDDSGKALAYWASPLLALKMMNITDLIITDTPERAKWAKLSLTQSRIAVIENEVDYDSPDLLSADIPVPKNGPLRILWYGNPANLLAMERYCSIFRNTSEYLLITCGASPKDLASVHQALRVECQDWSIDNFLRILRSCDITLLCHYGSKHDQKKSAHKMVTSICYGVPAIVSRTPAYSRIAVSLGIPEAVYDDEASLQKAIEWLKSPDSRKAYLCKTQNQLLSLYGKGSFARSAFRAINNLTLRKRRRSASVPECLPSSIRDIWYRIYNKIFWVQRA